MSDCRFERWNPIPEFGGRYYASSYGRVKNSSGKIMKQSVGRNGRLIITLRLNGKRVTRQVHRLIASAFLIKAEGKTEVNHIDGNPKNNNITNLEWCTRSENMSHSFAMGLHKPNTKDANTARRKKIVRSDGKVYESVTEAAKDSGLSQRGVSHILTGTSKNPRGYSFRYCEGDSND